jgi:hypothetical protein
VFTQVLGMARKAGMAQLGHVAIDSSRIAANAARRSVVDQRSQRARDRLQVRRYQRKATQPEGDENGGVVLEAQQQEALSEQLQQGTGLTPLPRPHRAQSSTTDPDSRFLRSRDGWVLGYTADLAVSQDHFIVATRVTQQATDNASLVPMVEEVQRQCRSHAEKVSADSGFFSGQALEFLDQAGIDGYLPDNNLKHEFSTGERAKGLGRSPIRNPKHLRMRQKLRSPAGRQIYRKRQAIVEPVFGILKQQRGLRRFHRRGLINVQTEWMLMAIAHNITRMRTL